MNHPWRRLSLWTRLLLLQLVIDFYSTSTAALETKSHHSVLVVRSLQAPHPVRTPSETLHQLAGDCHHRLGISQWDVYGDFQVGEKDKSFLRQFEAEVAHECGKEDAVFMPSGVMAQSIALLIHKEEAMKKASTSNVNKKNRFFCHATSHLLLHEEEGYQDLCGMEAVVLPLSPLSRLDEDATTNKEGEENETPSTVSPTQCGRGLGASPIRYHDLLEWVAFDEQQQEQQRNEQPSLLSLVSSLIVELPHRELGGKLTPWEDLTKMAAFCKEHKIAFHCDGARLFEASTGYDGMTLSELAAPFDSVYLSFYKGLGGMSGAMLCGSTSFCQQARVWLRRFGGNLYTLLPYAVSGWTGYRKYWCLEKEDVSSPTPVLTFQEKKDKLVRIVRALSDSSAVTQCITFEPSTPSTPMVHCYFRASTALCNQARDVVLERTGVSVFHRIKALPPDQAGYAEGYRSKLEISIGEANGKVSDHEWITSWQMFSTELLALLLPGQGKSL